MLDTSFIEGYEEKVEAVNRGKRGPPYRLAHSCVQRLSTVRYLYSMPHR